MDDAAYLRAICWTPFDDGPRLVWADALDERGECARAEFIRVQCELAWIESRIADVRRVVAEGRRGLRPPEKLLRRAEALGRRERELLLSPPPGSAYSRAEFWTPTALRSGAVACEVSTHPPTFRSLLSGMAWDFRRGFVAAVTLTAAQFFGGPCEKCEGRGYTLPGADSFLVERKGCSACGGDSWKDGTGRVEGLAAALFRAAPITEVRLSDREPHSFRDDRRAWWYTDPNWHLLGSNRHWLPVELRPFLTGRISEPVDEPRPGVCGFEYGDLMDETDGVELAHADCSAACVAVGRARAELPALVRPASADAPR